MSVSNPGIQAVPEVMKDEKEHRRHIVRAINNVMRGKIRATQDVTLTANQSSTIIFNPNIGSYSAIYWMPLTAHAAAEVTSGNMYVPQATLLKSQATINHSNASTTDRTLRLLIISP